MTDKEQRLKELHSIARNAIVVRNKKTKRARQSIISTLGDNRVVLTDRELLKLYDTIEKIENDLIFEFLDSIEGKLDDDNN